jgi:hypothetical protein
MIISNDTMSGWLCGRKSKCGVACEEREHAKRSDNILCHPQINNHAGADPGILQGSAVRAIILV